MNRLARETVVVRGAGFPLGGGRGAGGLCGLEKVAAVIEGWVWMLAVWVICLFAVWRFT